jgi:hypothetical protein
MRHRVYRTPQQEMTSFNERNSPSISLMTNSFELVLMSYGNARGAPMANIRSIGIWR